MNAARLSLSVETIGIVMLISVTASPAQERGQKKDQDEAIQLSPVVRKGVVYLVRMQHRDGGWGARWDIKAQFKKPHERTITPESDPGTTAFVAIALLRIGQTPGEGDLQVQMTAATKYLLDKVERSAEDSFELPSPYESQLDKKIGSLADMPVVTNYFARLSQQLPEDHELHERVVAAFDKCVKKLKHANQAPAEYKEDGWAHGLLQLELLRANEFALASGQEMDMKWVRVVRKYMAENLDLTNGRYKVVSPPGVDLYDYTATMWANSWRARMAMDKVEIKPSKKKLELQLQDIAEQLQESNVSEEKSRLLAASVYQNQLHLARLGDQKLLAGWGSLGGEELMCYRVIGEALLVAGGDTYPKWNETLHGQLARVQNADGSWYGHHCILSPVYNTAAAVTALTVHHDRELFDTIASKMADEKEPVKKRRGKKKDK